MRLNYLRKRYQTELSQLTIFAACTPRELRRIEMLCSRIDVPEGRLLCRQGEIGRQCFVVVEGSAVVSMDGVRAATIGAGELVGELALLAPSGHRNATVAAATGISLLVFSPSEFNALLSVSTVHRKVLRQATRRLVENSATHPTFKEPQGNSTSTPTGMHWTRTARSQMML